MKFRSYAATASGLVAIALFGWSCDWTGGSSDDFNTSGGSTTVNISGFYSGVLNSGLAVSNTSGGNITSLIVQQSGNSLDVRDNNGQTYKGNVGSPLTLASPDDLGLIPTGAQLASFQVSWSGKDGVAQRDIAFSGVISVVAIDSIQGTRQTTTRVDDSAVANTTTDQQNTNSTSGDSRNASTTETITTTSNTQQTGGNNQGQAVTEGSDSSIVRTTTDASQFANQSLGVSDQTQTTADTTTVNTTTVTQNDFVLTDANTQYRLRGSWVENGGVTASVDAIAAGAAGFISTATGPGAP